MQYGAGPQLVIGQQAAQALTLPAIPNLIIGNGAAAALANGSNTIVGHGAGLQMTTATNNVIVGNKAGAGFTSVGLKHGDRLRGGTGL